MAEVYASALMQLGLSISYHKSLISTEGAAEFAKRFRIRGLSKDVSPISIDESDEFSPPFLTDGSPDEISLQKV